MNDIDLKKFMAIKLVAQYYHTTPEKIATVVAENGDGSSARLVKDFMRENTMEELWRMGHCEPLGTRMLPSDRRQMATEIIAAQTGYTVEIVASRIDRFPQGRESLRYSLLMKLPDFSLIEMHRGE